MVSWHEEDLEDDHLIEDKRNGKVQKADIREPQKAHCPTSESVVA